MAQSRGHENQVAVVTGASTGIGAATARALAERGISVVLAARRPDKLAEVAADITRAGGTAVAYPADVTAESDIGGLFDAVEQQFGRLDFAVNNAGISARGRLMDLDVEAFDQAMAVNFRGTLLSMRAEIPALVRAGGGSIVNVASVGGLVGVPGLSAYTASKHAVVGLTKSVALEYAGQGIRVNAIAPGGTATEMFRSGTQEQRDFLASYSAMKRVAEPAEIAAAIVFLLVDATFCTGVVLPSDGGQTAG
jgi:A-factor type gamma-butyrolactone 1'-reductase (1S-forming)